MTYPHDYQPGEHRAALGDMLRDMDAAEVHTVRRTCPACGAGVSFYAGCRAEPDTGVAETPAGDYCDDACGWSDVHQPRDEDDALDEANYRAWCEGRDAA